MTRLVQPAMNHQNNTLPGATRVSAPESTLPGILSFALTRIVSSWS
ncbi:hypothetical protein [Acetobacter fallax]|nr:hypothetical protein [Acetobacter fallax]